MSDILLPKWKAGNGSAFMEGLERHLRHEVDLEKFESRKREIMANEEARRIGNHKVDGLGQLKAVIPAREYFRWHQQERGCWGDKQFNREFLRDNPQFKAEGNS